MPYLNVSLISNNLSREALIASLKYPRLTLIPLTSAISIIVTILAVKVIDHYNPEAMNLLKFKLIKFQKDYPVAPVLALVCLTTLGIVSISSGVLAAIPFGIFTGLRFEIDRITRLQELHAKGNPSQNLNHQLALS